VDEAVDAAAQPQGLEVLRGELGRGIGRGWGGGVDGGHDHLCAATAPLLPLLNPTTTDARVSHPEPDPFGAPRPAAMNSAVAPSGGPEFRQLVVEVVADLRHRGGSASLGRPPCDGKTGGPLEFGIGPRSTTRERMRAGERQRGGGRTRLSTHHRGHPFSRLMVSPYFHVIHSLHLLGKKGCVCVCSRR